MKPAIKEFFTELELKVLQLISETKERTQTFQTLHETLAGNDPGFSCT